MKTKGTPARLWKRVLAYVIDNILIALIVISPFLKSIQGESRTSVFDILTNMQQSTSTQLFIISLCIGLLTLFYWTFLESMYGQSVGKIIMGIRTQTVDRKPISVMQAITRNITKLSTVLLIMDTLYMLIRKQHQRLFEMLSNTIVIEEERNNEPTF